mmetsp:Transcript_28054/g.78683  ORF Transcript_28054/g.78683 Transcript_28054/m.78683 type:complete len:130 (+) Transcript_28054:34-423(+)
MTMDQSRHNIIISMPIISTLLSARCLQTRSVDEDDGRVRDAGTTSTSSKNKNDGGGKRSTQRNHEQRSKQHDPSATLHQSRRSTTLHPNEPVFGCSLCHAMKVVVVGLRPTKANMRRTTCEQSTRELTF